MLLVEGHWIFHSIEVDHIFKERIFSGCGSSFIKLYEGKQMLCTPIPFPCIEQGMKGRLFLAWCMIV